MKKKKINIIREIKNVFELEINTLNRIKDTINSDFKKAVEIIFQSKGKIIVTGIGKSGLIAQKISATLTSTGTPAIFLHPAEGMHGDLGIIKKKDIIIAIGKSGESEEMIAIIPVIKEIGAKIIAITSNKNSTLAKSSNVVLYADVIKEACPHNLAPTSSTTAALVIGDALAVTLMKLRDFKPEHFALYHPGGRLGKRLLLKVKDIMRSGSQNPVIKKDDSVKNMLFEITRKRTGAVSVIDKNKKLCGLVTDYDIRKIVESTRDLFSLTITDVMNSNPSYIYSDEKAVSALELMENRKRPILLLPVLDRKTKKVIGMIHLHDILSKNL
ncbi:SIS domain-containing protein [bacterium]